MSGTMDQSKGRAERAVGEALDDDRMKRRGSVDKAVGRAKDALDGLAGWAKGKIGKRPN